MPESTTWKDIWERKGRVTNVAALELRNLIEIDGFDSGSGAISLPAWTGYVASIRDRLGLSAGDRVYEVGCGAGAFLYPLFQQGTRVAGVDGSSGLINVCRQMMPQGEFACGDASDAIPSAEPFDAVVSNSVFQYFPSLAHAELVVNRMIDATAPDGTVAVLDVNDEAKLKLCEAARRRELGDDAFERLYANVRHQFYSQGWFEKLGTSRGLDVEILPQQIRGYGNALYRFNVFMSPRI